MKVVTQW